MMLQATAREAAAVDSPCAGDRTPVVRDRHAAPFGRPHPNGCEAAPPGGDRTPYLCGARLQLRP